MRAKIMRMKGRRSKVEICATLETLINPLIQVILFLVSGSRVSSNVNINVCATVSLCVCD